MPTKKYIVNLTPEERNHLLDMVNKGTLSARKMKRAQILLKADEGWTDQGIMEALNTSHSTVERTRKRFVEGNLDKALNEDPRPGSRSKIDGRVEAHLIALSCSDAPDGHEKWSLRMLADKVVELGLLESVSHETIRTCLKKMN